MTERLSVVSNDLEKNYSADEESKLLRDILNQALDAEESDLSEEPYAPDEGEEASAPAPAAEEDLADSIAQAIADSFGAEDNFDFSQQEAELEDIPVEADDAPAATPPDVSDAPEENSAPEPETQEKPQAPAGAPQRKRNPNDTGRTKKPAANKKTAEPAPKAAPEEKQAPAKKAEEKPDTANTASHDRKRKAPSAPAKNPGTDYVKITRTTVRVSMKEQLESTFGGVLERQRAALPPMGVDLKAHERKLAAKTGIDRMLSPVRYVIFILMMLCLAGRKYAWMTLGFMSGMQGVYVAMLMTLVAMAVCWQSTCRAFRDVFFLRFSHESLLLLATLLTVLEAVAKKNASSLLPLLTMSWCVTGMGTLMQSQGDLRSLRAVITGRNKVGLRLSEKLWKGYDIIGKAPSGTAGFVRRQAEPDPWHVVHTAFFIPMLLVCLVASAVITSKGEISYLSALVTLLDIGMPVSMALCCARPYNLLTQALSGQGVVAGWFGIKALSGRKAVMIYDSDLFPKGTINPKGIKTFGRMTMEQLVSYGASIVLRANLGLDAPFQKLVYQTGAQIYDVSGLSVQEGGVEGRIHQNQVQIGTYQYMQLMGVSMPRKGSSNGVYMAVNGRLEGMFGIKYAMRSGSISGFHRFVREKAITCLVVTRNFTINPAFIERSFKAPITRMLCPKTGVRRHLAQPTVLRNSTVCGYTLREGVSAYSRTVGGARRIRRMGLMYSLFSVFFSLYLMIDTATALASGGAMIEPTRILLVHLLLFLAVEIGARIAVRQ